MLRISQLDWPRILYRRNTAILLGIAAIFSIGAVVLFHSNINPDTLGPVQNVLVGFLGVAGTAGFLGLLVCMGFFWLRCDNSSKLNRTIWFVILLLGFYCGTHVAYYAIVYLPQAVKRIRSGTHEIPNVLPDETMRDDKRFGPFRRPLLLIWAAPAITILSVLLLHRPIHAVTAVVTIVFFICSAAVAVEAVCHFVLSVYRSGMGRSDHTN